VLKLAMHGFLLRGNACIFPAQRAMRYRP
jgi:hypothetical protein